jgi:hypothetical protein
MSQSIAETSLFCQRLALHHCSGVILHPVRIKSRASGKLAFILSKEGNKRDVAVEIDDENDVIRMVTQDSYAVRCADLKRSRSGLFNLSGRSILHHQIKSI